MSLNPKAEVWRLRQELTETMAMTLPEREFGAAMVMAMVGLHMTEAQIRKTQDLQERRRLLDEFIRERDIIEKAITRLREESYWYLCQSSARQASMP